MRQERTSVRQRVLATAVALALLAAACGGGSGDSSSDPSTSTGAGVTTSPVTTSPATTTPATTSPETTSPETTSPETTSPATTSPVTTTPVTTTPVTTTVSSEFDVDALDPIDGPADLDNGDPATCAITIGVSEAAAPFSSISGDKVGGLEPALARDLVDLVEGPVDICFVGVRGSERFERLAAGDIDMLIRLTTRTAEREGLAAWTGPYLLDGAVVITSQTSATSVSDLTGTFAHLAGGPDIAASVPQLTVTTEDSFGALSDQLESGAVDSIGLSSYMSALIQFGGSPDFTVLFTNTGVHPIAMAFPTDDTTRRDVYDAALDTLRSSGRWAERFVAELGVSPPYTTEELAAGSLDADSSG